MSVTALAPWFGSNRLCGPAAAKLLDGCEWVGVGFAGGLSEVFEMKARTILVNDRHRWVINLARCVAERRLLRPLTKTLERLLVHPDELAAAQKFCRTSDPGDVPDVSGIFGHPDLDMAAAYFVSVWMGRSGNAGTPQEFTGGLALRYNAGGGDSAVRYYSAVKALAKFHQTLRRCTFSTDDVFDMLAKCHDKPKHGYYMDPPFPTAGQKYTHNAGEGEAERIWHARLAQAMSAFAQAKVVMRFHDHPLVRELYPEDRWTWHLLEGRTQANKEATEVLLVNKL